MWVDDEVRHDAFAREGHVLLRAYVRAGAHACACVCVCVCAYVRACVCVYARACASAHARAQLTLSKQVVL